MDRRIARTPASGVNRRSMIERTAVGLGGLATAQFPSAALTPAQAGRLGPSEVGAGPLATPDPIKEPIQKSGVAVELVDFVRAPHSGGDQFPYSRLNFTYHAGIGSNRLFTCDTRGFLYEIIPATGAIQLMLDVRLARGTLWLGANLFMGLRSFAFHPDFARPGRPGYQKLYTVNTEVPSGVARFGGPYTAHHHDVISEWMIDPANPARVNPASRREVLRIAQWGIEHNTDQLMFDPHLQPGAPGYGMMLIGIGDGGNSPLHTDPYNQVQDPANVHGKILRIDPLASGGAAYSVPPDNPWVGVSGVLPEIWAMGFRHPQNISYDIGNSGKLLISDIGQHQVEEVNLGYAGHNYGWPIREGAFTTDRGRVADLYNMPADQAARGYANPVAQYDHGEGIAITGGFVYRGTSAPELVGHYLFGDIKNGRIFHIPVDELVLGQQATVRELTLLRNGQVVTLAGLISSPKNRVDLRFGQDQSGEVFITTKQDGWIRRLRSGTCSPTQCNIDGLEYIASYPDLIQAYGADAAAGQRHYAQYGQYEGRVPDLFNAYQYLANYADLRAAFGNNLQAARTHYIQYGFYEGRTDAA